jgi:hypothetical protein
MWWEFLWSIWQFVAEIPETIGHLFRVFTRHGLPSVFFPRFTTIRFPEGFKLSDLGKGWLRHLILLVTRKRKSKADFEHDPSYPTRYTQSQLDCLGVLWVLVGAVRHGGMAESEKSLRNC